MTFIEYLSFVVLGCSAVVVFRKAPLPAFSLFIAWAANLAYAKGIVQSESVRWVSALVGLVGAIEFGRGTMRTERRMPVSIPDALRKVDGGAWIGLALLASMGVDGFGMFVWKAFGVWIVPEATIGILLLVIAIGLFGKDKP